VLFLVLNFIEKFMLVVYLLML